VKVVPKAQSSSPMMMLGSVGGFPTLLLLLIILIVVIVVVAVAMSRSKPGSRKTIEPQRQYSYDDYNRPAAIGAQNYPGGPAPSPYPEYRSAPVQSAPPYMYGQPSPGMSGVPVSSVGQIVLPSGKVLDADKTKVLGRDDLAGEGQANMTALVSRGHIEITKDAMGFVLIKDGVNGVPSTNGTTVNGSRISSSEWTRLNNNDAILLAGVIPISFRQAPIEQQAAPQQASSSAPPDAYMLEPISEFNKPPQ